MSAGNWIAIAAVAAALLSNGITLIVTRYVQRQQDRRDKRQRVHASFRKVLLATERLVGTTAPLNGLAWKRDEDMSPPERGSFYDMLSDVQRDFQEAAVDLTLEGITDPAEQVEEMFRAFTLFRFARSRPELDERAVEQVEAVKATAALLRQELPKVLNEVRPDRRWWRSIRRRPR